MNANFINPQRIAKATIFGGTLFISLAMMTAAVQAKTHLQQFQEDERNIGSQFNLKVRGDIEKDYPKAVYKEVFDGKYDAKAKIHHGWTDGHNPLGDRAAWLRAWIYRNHEVEVAELAAKVKDALAKIEGNVDPQPKDEHKDDQKPWTPEQKEWAKNENETWWNTTAKPLINSLDTNISVKEKEREDLAAKYLKKPNKDILNQLHEAKVRLQSLVNSRNDLARKAYTKNIQDPLCKGADKEVPEPQDLKSIKQQLEATSKTQETPSGNPATDNPGTTVEDLKGVQLTNKYKEITKKVADGVKEWEAHKGDSAWQKEHGPGLIADMKVKVRLATQIISENQGKWSQEKLDKNRELNKKQYQAQQALEKKLAALPNDTKIVIQNAPKGAKLHDATTSAEPDTDGGTVHHKKVYHDSAHYGSEDVAKSALRDAARRVAQDAARDAARFAVQEAVKNAARDAARFAARNAAREAARSAARTSVKSSSCTAARCGVMAAVHGCP